MSDRNRRNTHASGIFIANLTSSLDLYYKNRPKLTQMQRPEII
jgi:hypothetical protein